MQLYDPFWCSQSTDSSTFIICGLSRSKQRVFQLVRAGHIFGLVEFTLRVMPGHYYAEATQPGTRVLELSQVITWSNKIEKLYFSVDGGGKATYESDYATALAESFYCVCRQLLRMHLLKTGIWQSSSTVLFAVSWKRTGACICR